MSSTYGENLHLTIFGQSHSPAIGVTVEGIPAGEKVDLDELQRFLNRRAPGKNVWSTPRKEADAPEILSGLVNGYTCGAPLTAVIRNTNTRSQDYANLAVTPRPGHADYTAEVKYGGYQDRAGGGHFSGRLTAPLCIAGGICLQILAREGITVVSRIASIAGITDEGELTGSLAGKEFPVVSDARGEEMREAIAAAREAGDSVGGVIECAVFGAPAGLGDPMFGGMENRIASAVFGIPAVKGIEFGAGFGVSKLRGSEDNDAFTVKNGGVVTETNHCGGILGGITNGMPIVFRAAFKPTPSIAREQQSVNLQTMVPEKMAVTGRHDPCIVPRAVPCVEAAAAIAVYDAYLSRKKEMRSGNMDLNDYRKEIDSIDDQLIALFAQRMETAEKIAEYKKANGLRVLDARREREKMREILDKTPADLREYVSSLYSLIFELSRSRQSCLLGTKGDLPAKIAEAIEKTPQLFPEDAAVACQGVEGAYSEQACERLFKRPSTFFFSSFEAVFSAIEKGLCRYGVLPLENSTAGSVNAVYDLMTQHNFRIVRSVRIKVDHNLLANPGAKLENIREIYSHEQAISQCAHFLQGLPNVKVIRCENTAVAARMVAESGRDDVAALSSRACRELYGLDCLAASVQDQGNNFTRFICIAKNLEIYPGADRTSLMMVLPHHPGSLYKVLSRFNALGVNMNKLESRPMPDRNFEFMFYFDLETSVYAPQFTQLMGELPELCEEFTYLGSYSEVV